MAANIQLKACCSGIAQLPVGDVYRHEQPAKSISNNVMQINIILPNANYINLGKPWKCIWWFYCPLQSSWEIKIQQKPSWKLKVLSPSRQWQRDRDEDEDLADLNTVTVSNHRHLIKTITKKMCWVDIGKFPIIKISCYRKKQQLEVQCSLYIWASP